jgi:hypothetical protein
MGYGFRHFLFEADGTMRPLSQRVADGLVAGTDYLPQYAGFTLRHAFVTLEVEGKKPIRIIRLEGSNWRFDYAGSMRDFLVEGARAAQSSFIPMDDWEKRGREPSADAIEARKAFEEKHRWTPGTLEINKIIHAIWPKDAGQPVERQPVISGVSKRRAPMTRDAEHAIREIQSSVWKYEHLIEELSDTSLKAFRQEALHKQREHGADAEGQMTSGIWSGIAAAADACALSRARWKNPKGTWFAVLNVWREVSKRESHSVAEDFPRCTGKKAAIEAARLLLAENAGRFDDKTEIDVKVYPEGEWFPPSVSRD